VAVPSAVPRRDGGRQTKNERNRREGLSARNSTALRAPVVSVQIPLPVLDSLQAAQGDLFALFVDTGREVLRAMMEQDRVALCGPKGKRVPERAAVRAGSTRSEVTLGGQRITVRRLRARSAGGELVLPSFAFAADRDPLDRRTWRAIARGVSTRDYRDVVDQLPAPEVGRAISKSAVSRRFVALSTDRLRELTERPIGDLAIRAVLIDGIVFHDHTILIALGVTAEGKKHVLALREGATENATVAKALLEGLPETLTLQRLGVRGALYRTLRSTNAIENLNGSAARFTRNVKNWQGGAMLLRWVGAGIVHAAVGFRRVRGHADISKLIAALDRAIKHNTLDHHQKAA